MTTLIPADTCEPPRTLRESLERPQRLEELLIETLPYLRGIEVQQESGKLAELIKTIVRETA